MSKLIVHLLCTFHKMISMIFASQMILTCPRATSHSSLITSYASLPPLCTIFNLLHNLTTDRPFDTDYRRFGPISRPPATRSRNKPTDKRRWLDATETDQSHPTPASPYFPLLYVDRLKISRAKIKRYSSYFSEMIFALQPLFRLYCAMDLDFYCTQISSLPYRTTSKFRFALF